MRALDGVGALLALQGRGRQEEQARVDHARHAQRPVDVDPGGAQQALEVPFAVVLVGGGDGAALVVVHQRGVQVDGVRHDGGAQHRGGDQHGVGALEAGDHAPGDTAPVGRGGDQARQEPQGDDDQEGDDGVLEAALAPAALDEQQRHRHRADDDAAPHQGDAEEQVEGERPAYHLGQVGGGGDDLGLRPEGDAPRGGEPAAQQGGQGLAGDEPQFGRQVLDDHGGQVRGDQDPHEQVPVAGAGGDVGRDVAGVDVGDGRHESGSQQWDDRVLVARVLGCGHGSPPHFDSLGSYRAPGAAPTAPVPERSPAARTARPRAPVRPGTRTRALDHGTRVVHNGGIKPPNAIACCVIPSLVRGTGMGEGARRFARPARCP